MSVGRNSIANLIGSIVPLLITLATVPVYLRLIGAERYGALAVIWVVFSYFGFFDFGLGQATAQRMAKLKESSIDERSQLFWTSFLLTLVLGIIAGVVLWFFCRPAIDSYRKSKRGDLSGSGFGNFMADAFSTCFTHHFGNERSVKRQRAFR